MIKRPPTTN